jgi:hypothetical protein
MLLNRLLIAWLPLACVLSLAASRTASATETVKPSVTVFPVSTKPNRFPDDLAKRVAIVVATLLEKAGLETLEVADTVFQPPDAGVEKMADAFAAHVRERTIKTDFAVFAQFVGAPQTGVKQISTIVVDRTGKVLLAESAGEKELGQAPTRPTDPMTCCVFVGRRLQEFWQLDDPMRSDAPQGKMAEFWKRDAGIPSDVELKEIERRMEAMRGELPTASCTVYPVHVGEQFDDQCAAELVAGINETGLFRTRLSEVTADFKVKGHSNEQKVLWDTARAFRDYVKQNPPPTDYALYADYGLFGNTVGYVHMIICDQSGNWVLIDMQNSHHSDFKDVGPKTTADCNDLLRRRLRKRLSE